MPILHAVVGPNGAGKTTLVERVLVPATRLPCVNADEIARALWPGDEEARAYDAAALAARRRTDLLDAGRSFIAETVFSHPSKVELLRDARARGYLVHLHVVLVPLALSLARVPLRVQQGGHGVPAEKVRGRFARLWPLVASAVGFVDEATIYDNTKARTPWRVVARYERGLVVLQSLPRWSPLRPR